MYIDDTTLPKASPIEYKDWTQFQEGAKKYGIPALHRTKEPNPTGYVIWFPFQGFIHRFKIPGGFQTYEGWEKGKAVGIEQAEHYQPFINSGFQSADMYWKARQLGYKTDSELKKYLQEKGFESLAEAWEYFQEGQRD